MVTVRQICSVCGAILLGASAYAHACNSAKAGTPDDQRRAFVDVRVALGTSTTSVDTFGFEPASRTAVHETGGLFGIPRPELEPLVVRSGKVPQPASPPTNAGIDISPSDWSILRRLK